MIAFCLFLACPSDPALAATNLLPNSSFEEGEAGWTLWHEKPGATSGGVAEGEGFLGEHAFRVVSPGEAAANLYSDPIPCRPGQAYTLSVYARVTGGTKINIALWGLAEDGEIVSYAIGGEAVLPDECPVWGHYQKAIFTPENCTQLKAHLLCNGGEVIWDAVKIEAGRSATKYCDGPVLTADRGRTNLLVNSGFEQGKTGWTLWHQHADRSEGKTEDGVYRVINGGDGGANLFSDSTPCEPNTMYTLSALANTRGGRDARVCGWALTAGEETLTYSIDEGTILPSDTPEPTRFSTTFTTPDDCTLLRAHLICNGGEVWWDDVQLERSDTATPYVPGPEVYDPDTPERRALARRYSEAMVREARLADAVRQARRLAEYADSVDSAAVDRAEERLGELRDELHAEYLVPGFAAMDHERIDALAQETEGVLARVWQAAGLAPPSFDPWQPELPRPLSKETLAQEILIFPCFTRQFHHAGDADWGILEPFGFRIVSGWIGVRTRPNGERDYGAHDHFAQVSFDHGYPTDTNVSAESVVGWLFGSGGEDEQMYLHAANGEWSRQGNCHNTVNIWHPRVRAEGARFLTEYGQRYADDERVVAMELTNEPALTIEKHVEGYQYERVGVGGYSDAAKAAWEEWLKKRHGTIEYLNQRWGVDYAQFADARPPEDLAPSAPTDGRTAIDCGPINDFQRFRAESHAEYFKTMVDALRAGNPRAPIMPQFHHGNFGRKDAAIDLYLMATVPGWDYFGTHDWPGDRPAVNSLYAVSMNRYAKLPHWEDEFIWSQWERKGTPEPIMRAAVERNLWRQIAWGKRGISLFNLESEWLHDSPHSWNNSMLNIEADLMVPRYCTGAMPAVERKANLIKQALLDTELAPQGVALLAPMHSVYGAAPDGRPERDATALAAYLLERHWLALMVPEECIVGGLEDLRQHRAIIAPWAVNVSDALQGGLEIWVRDGGTLIASGPFGLFDPWGNPSGSLMRAAFGEFELRYDPESNSWSGAPERGDVTDGVWKAALGEGLVIVSPTPLGEEKRQAVVSDALAEAIPIQPVGTDVESIELLLRQAPDGTRYLFAINLSAREARRGSVRVAGTFTDVRELTVEGAPRAPAQADGGVTLVPIVLEPGECLCFELRAQTP